ncbi:MAG: hypothetical protein E6H07_12865 [Bacteroidetes bacterium]|nr:MAG: hypothetical protein E6H07_12865 [Bacteroidota bacterium]
MDTRFDIAELRKNYSASWYEAVNSGRFILSYHIDDWNQKLNAVEKRTYHDIRFIGLQLYPIFPVSDDQYLHFANPFKMVGIEIVYKNSPELLIERKTKLLEGLGWKIYTINSENTYHTIEEFFRIKRKDKSLEWEELDGELASLFSEKYHTKSAPCLLYYLQQKYFENIDA